MSRGYAADLKRVGRSHLGIAVAAVYVSSDVRAESSMAAVPARMIDTIAARARDAATKSVVLGVRRAVLGSALASTARCRGSFGPRRSPRRCAASPNVAVLAGVRGPSASDRDAQIADLGGDERTREIQLTVL